MSSENASGQRKALKALALTPYDVFENEHAEIILERVAYKDAENKPREAAKANDEDDLNEDLTMDEDEGFQCGYCGDYHEDWIRCENKACTIQWYGLECVGLEDAPAGRWICAMCRPRPVFPNLGGAPKIGIQDDVQQKPKGVAINKRNLDKPKPRSGWKGWVEVPGEVKEKMQREADAQWEVKALAKRTRTGVEIYEGKQKRRLTRRMERNNRISQREKYQEAQQRSIPQLWKEDSRSMDDDQLAQEAAAAVDDRGRSPLLEEMVYPGDDGVTDEEAEDIDEGISARPDRESTFEGFSDSQKADSIGSSLRDTGVVDDEVVEAEDLSPADQSSNSISDADEDQDFEMTDDVESGLDGLSVVDEDEKAESFQSGNQLSDVVRDGDNNRGVERRASAIGGFTEVDVGGGSPMETLGVGAMDYTYLDLYGYGPYLVRRS